MISMIGAFQAQKPKDDPPSFPSSHPQPKGEGEIRELYTDERMALCHAIIAMHADLCRLFLFVKHDAESEPTVSLHDHSDRGQLTLQLLLLLMPTCITSIILMLRPERNISK